MRDILRKAKPQRLEDLIALNALYRPGPLRGGVVDDYIARKHGRVEIKYELPQMEPSSRRPTASSPTRSRSCASPASWPGFTLGQADVLRQAMGKKDAAKMQAAARRASSSGCRARGIPEKKATKIFELMEYFAGYGFNKSHSTDLRAARVPDGVSQGELPAALHGGAADDRIAEHRQGRAVPRRVPRARRAALELRGVAKSYGSGRARSEVLTDIDLTIADGGVRGHRRLLRQRQDDHGSTCSPRRAWPRRTPAKCSKAGSRCAGRGPTAASCSRAIR